MQSVKSTKKLLEYPKIDEVKETARKSCVLDLWATLLTLTKFGSSTQSFNKPGVTWDSLNRGSMWHKFRYFPVVFEALPVSLRARSKQSALAFVLQCP